MNNKFDELTKSLAQSVTRRAALKKFCFGLAGMALAAVGLANKAEAGQGSIPRWCDQTTNPCCCKKCNSYLPANDTNWWSCQGACQLACGR
jgi:hypothetical protein